MAVVKTNNGKAGTANRMKGGTPAQLEFQYIGVGTATGPATATDTVLTTEVGTTRVTGTTSFNNTVNVTNDTYRVTGTYVNASGGAQTLKQAANFDTNVVGSTGINIKGDFTADAILQIGDGVLVTINETFA